MKKVAIFTIVLLSFGFMHRVFASGIAYVTSTGQTIYYQFNGIDNGGGVKITFPGNQYGNNCWGYYTKPTDTLVIPSSITFEGTSYPVTKIGEDAFRGCDGLTCVIIPNSVTHIEQTAFYGCSALVSVSLPTSVVNMGSSIFANCTSLDSVIIPSSMSYISSGLFNGCTNLASVTIPNSILTIGASAFEGCIALTSITLPNSTTNIGSSAFEHCTGLTSMVFPESISIIGGNAFYYCTGLTSITLPDSITSIEYGTFRSCTNLSSITIPNTVSNIGNFAFYNCPNLSSITLPSTTTTIGKFAFSKCNGLTSFTIPDSVSSIGAQAFDSCINLTTINFNAVNCTVATEMYSSANYVFDGCASLTTITFGTNVQRIPSYFFRRCQGIDTMIIPNTVVYIGNHAFSECQNLNTVLIPNSVVTMGNNVFSGCSSLSSVKLSDSIITIGDYVFYECSNLTSIVIPEGVISIGEGAFAYCNNLDDIFILPATPPTISNQTNYWNASAPSYYRLSFYGMQDQATFHVPCGTSDAYYNAWSDHYNYSEPTVTFDFSVASSDSVVGSVSIIQDIICQDSSVVIQATLLNPNYHFSSWSNGNTANPDTLYLDGDSTITAIFERNQYTVTTYSNDTSMGYVEGGDNYLYQDTAQLIAVPMEYHHFVQWSDGNIDNPRQWVVVADTQFTAFFEADTFQLNAISNNNMQGIVSGSGTFPYGIPVTISATANTGYHFTHWSNGNTNNPDTLYLISDSTITAFFERNQYTLTVQSNNTSFGEVEGGGSYLYQDTALLIATANDTYHFVRWNDGNTDNPRQYIVTGNATLTATFAIDTFHVNVASNNIAYGGVSGEGDYQYGTPATVTATAYTGYHFSQWSNGITANPYTFAVLQDTELTAVFVEDGTQGIDNIESSDVHVYLHNGKIVVSGVDKESIYLYDIYGRLLTIKQAEYSQSLLDIPSSGLYLVKVGNHPAKKIVVRGVL